MCRLVRVCHRRDCQRGWTEGANLIVERYGRERNAGDIDAPAAAAMRANPDVVFVIGPGVFEARAHAGTIPLVTFTSIGKIEPLSISSNLQRN
jgi:hypothetical protein